MAGRRVACLHSTKPRLGEQIKPDREPSPIVRRDSTVWIGESRRLPVVEIITDVNAAVRVVLDFAGQADTEHAGRFVVPEGFRQGNLIFRAVE